LSEAALGGPKLWICIAAMTAAFLALLDITIVNICLPQIQTHFGADVDQLGWVTTAYMIANVIAMPLTGFFRARWGYRRYFVVSALVFAAGSGLCALATTFEGFVLARAVQGLGGGALIPLSQAMLLDRFPKSEVGLAGALFGVAAMAGPVLGPSVGGHLLEHVSWPWLFWVSVPFAGAAAAVIAVHLVEPPAAKAGRVDLFGFALLAVGLGSLQFLLEEGPRRAWLESPVIVGCAVLAALCLPALVIHSLEHEDPVVDVSVFASARFSAASLLNLVLGIAMITGGFFNALFFANVLGYSPLAIGDLLFWANAVDFVAIPASSLFMKYVDGRSILLVGLVLLVWSFFLNASLGPTSDFGALVFPATMRSLGSSLLYVPLTIAAFVGLDERRRTGAVGLFNVLRELGASVGTASLAHVLKSRSEHHGVEIARAIRPIDLSDPRLGGPATIGREVVKLAALSGFADVYVVLGVVSALTLPCLFLLRSRPST